MALDAEDQPGYVIRASGEIVAQAPGRRTGIGRQRGLAQVAVDREHLPALEREAGCGVDGNECLSAADVEGGEHANFSLSPGRCEHEFHIGAQHPERLVDHVSRSMADDYLPDSPVDVGLPQEVRQQMILLVLTDKRYLAREGHGQLLQILASAYSCVQHLTQHDHAHRNQQAQHEGYHEHLVPARRCGDGIPARRIDDSRIVGGERLR